MPNRIDPRKRFRLGFDTMQTCIPINICGADEFDITKIEVYIRRRGQEEWLRKYPAQGISDNGELCISWDEELFKLCAGRYEAEIRYDCSYCDTFEITVPGKPIIMSVRDAINSDAAFVDSKPTLVKPDGVVLDVYDFILDLCFTLPSAIDTTCNQIPVPDNIQVLLENNVLCKHVDLKIESNGGIEFIRYGGVLSGNNIIVDRGVSSTTPLCFPAGSKVSFCWNEYNILNASKVCP